MEKEHKTEAHYRELYLRWQSSGLTLGTFCQQESIKYATFRYWAKKFEQSDNGVPGFTELKLSRPSIMTSSGPIAVLSLGTQATLSLYELPDPAWLRSLLL
ncbi:IS66 family insertion sequence element accessory protein TnpA [Dyadobacter tibetensis]|uniref:IS66 family insertion sequence element accessory protein TnpA n=1 Tax=Dyadobacter tibetensis TaxID=1211851 RepID=UPI0004701E3E